MSFQQSLKQIQMLLQTELITFFGKKRKEAEKIDTELVSIVDQIADLTLRGGKRFRPFLCWLGYQLMPNAKCQMPNFKTNEGKMLIGTMLSLELFHTFALIHDDVIDQDKARRGGNTIHEYFKVKACLPARQACLPARQGKRKNVIGEEARHFGTSMAILAGDLALSWADELMGEVARLSLRAERSNLNFRKIATSSQRNIGAPRNDMGTWRVYQKMKEQMIIGQSLDVMRQFGNAHISQTKINELKTAWYSVIWPLTIGAILANAPQKDIHYLQRYGLLVGQAFQLRDDFLDGEIGKKEFAAHVHIYKNKIQQVIEEPSIGDQLRTCMSDIAIFVVTRDS